MDDYKSEKEQWEDIKRWLKENGAWIIAGAAIGAGGLYGYRFWQAHEDQQAVAANAHYVLAVEALNRNKSDEAVKEIAELDQQFARTPYGDQARLALAAWYVERGKVADAADPLRHVMDDSRDDAMQFVARLRLARVLVELGKPDEALALLDAAGPSGFDPRFQEVRGDILLAKGDRAGALAAYRAAADSTVPEIVNKEYLNLKIADLADVATAPKETAAAAGEAHP